VPTAAAAAAAAPPTPRARRRLGLSPPGCVGSNPCGPIFGADREPLLPRGLSGEVISPRPRDSYDAVAQRHRDPGTERARAATEAREARAAREGAAAAALASPNTPYDIITVRSRATGEGEVALLTAEQPPGGAAGGGVAVAAPPPWRSPRRAAGATFHHTDHVRELWLEQREGDAAAAATTAAAAAAVAVSVPSHQRDTVAALFREPEDEQEYDQWRPSTDASRRTGMGCHVAEQRQ
jgi:hypothetical protein